MIASGARWKGGAREGTGKTGGFTGRKKRDRGGGGGCEGVKVTAGKRGLQAREDLNAEIYGQNSCYV